MLGKAVDLQVVPVSDDFEHVIHGASTDECPCGPKVDYETAMGVPLVSHQALVITPDTRWGIVRPGDMVETTWREG